ncbi:cache domain-containing sensor histidine kinase [Alicyclobacillus fodiniaquatilis]|uniref:Sensor histidine kinase n=1 Tax=Alicyclobacillus fodiniaquatilis TaxID=1661150 RepID=A0ABW4JNB1_9BACL
MRLQWVKGWKLATKQFITLVLISLVLFVPLTTLDTHVMGLIFEDQLNSDLQVFIHQTNQYIDSYVSNVEDILLLLSSRKDLLQNHNQIQVEETLEQYCALDNGIIQTIYLVKKDGTVYASNQVAYATIGNPYLAKLCRLAKQNYGAINSSSPYQSPISGKTIAFVRPITDNSGNALGTAIVEIDLAQLNNSLSNVLYGKYENFVLLTGDEKLITYDSPSTLSSLEASTFPPRLNQAFLKMLTTLPNSLTSVQLKGQSLMIIKSNTNYLGWNIISLVDKNVFYQDMIRMYHYYWIIGVIWFAVLCLIVYFFSRNFSKPIRRLAATMDEIQALTNPSFVSTDRTDEIGRLALSYNRMLKRIQDLLTTNGELEARKKDYELKMLQSQIGPHFLYNTLACISSLAKQGETEKVRETIHSLVGLISMSFDKVSPFITLAKEIQALQMFAQIQQVRYGSCFSLNIDIPEDILDSKVPKLTLQPLVENAIFHGILPNQQHGTIWIRGHILRDKLMLYVFDNGVGMHEAQVSQLFANTERHIKKRGLNKIGVKNVHERIQIYFGEHHHLRIKSRWGTGTVARICLPVQTCDTGNAPE